MNTPNYSRVNWLFDAQRFIVLERAFREAGLLASANKAAEMKDYALAQAKEKSPSSTAKEPR